MRASRRLLGEQTRIGCLGLAVAIAAAAVMNTVRLSQNGYANIFYSAGVRSMIRSWHNFLFVSFDSGGLVERRQATARAMGAGGERQGVRLLPAQPASSAGADGCRGRRPALPDPLRRLGAAAAFAGALTLAVFPSFVAVSRENGVDPLLILLLVMACGAAIKACETGRWRTLIWCGVLVGLAFNTKTLAAYLAVPRDRLRLPGVRAGLDVETARPARARGGRDGGRLILLDGAGGSDAGLQTPLRRQLH